MESLINAQNSKGDLLFSSHIAKLVAITFFTVGAYVFFVFNDVLHHYLPEDIIECENQHGNRVELDSRDGTPQQNTRQNGSRAQSNQGSVQRQSSYNSNDTTPLLSGHDHEPGENRIHAPMKSCKKGVCAGYSDPCCHLSNTIDGDLIRHHHHVERQAAMRLAIQTSVAMLHKIPEGFITFTTTRANPALGLNVFLSLFFHNLAEGFVCVYPLFRALGSRNRAFLWASLISGVSQPLGAFMGWLWLRFTNVDENEGLVFGIMFAAVSGMLILISIQTMLPQAYKNDVSSGNLPTIGTFTGILTIAISSCFV